MKLVTLTSPNSAVAEAYRTLRTNVQFAVTDTGMKTLVVAAPDAGGSAAEAAANLAVVFAQSGRRTILVDGDLRDPQVHALLGASNDSGVIQALSTDASALLQEGPVHGMRILTSGRGPVIASDVLSSPNVVDVLRELSSQADVVLIAAPPVDACADAALLASVADAVLLVVTRNRTRIVSLNAARQAFTRARATLLGVFMA